MMGLLPHSAFAEDGALSIYVMTFSDQDAIILECDGHFAMVDAGEDNDYPDGSDVRYPYRPGTTIGYGHEYEVVSYLESLGATPGNFDFFIGTHAHSDHIGAADDVVRAFSPQRVYVPRYSDDLISNPANLWDNQYVYDQLVSAVEDAGSLLITDLQDGAPIVPEEGGPASPTFSLGGAQITIMNWDNHDLSSETFNDANDYCWGVLVSYEGKTAFLSGDINNVCGDEDALSWELGHVDVLKLGHHGSSGSNNPSYLRALSPSVVLQTGPFYRLPTNVVDTLIDLGCHHYVGPESASQGFQAMVVRLSDDGIETTALADPNSFSFRQQCGSYAAVAYQDGAPTAYTGEWTSGSGQRYVFDGTPFGESAGVPEPETGVWKKDRRGWRWINEDGSSPASEWESIGGKTYYFDSSGYMVTGWVKVDGLWYYLDASGALCKGWAKVNGSWFYLNPSNGGAMVTGFFSVDGVRYFAQSSGVCPASAWIKTGGYWYRSNASCALCSGWAKVGGTWYWFDPESNIMAADGWADIDGIRYYFDASGAMATGWRKVNGSWYWFAPSGAVATGWCKVSGSWYWLDPDTGVMATGWLDDGDARYYLASSGKMVTGWQKIDGSWYLFASSGKMTTGWQKSSGKWYWLDPETGIMLADGRTPDGNYVDKNGAWVPGR